MKNGKINLFIVSTLLFSFFLTACSTVPVNLRFAKDDVIEYHKSGKYDDDLNEIIEDAKDEFNEVKPDKNSAVIFDVDETTLNNYSFNKKSDFGYIPSLWDNWIEEADAPAIPQVKSLYDFLLSKGFKLIFITGRNDKQYEATLQNLKFAGYSQFDTLITKSPKYEGVTAQEYKSQERNALVQKGYKIAGTVGDQYSDLNGPNSGIKIKIPNYQYIIY